MFMSGQSLDNINQIAGMGHNSSEVMTITIKLFNSVAKVMGAGRQPIIIEVPVETTLGDIVRLMQIPVDEVCLTLINGSDPIPTLKGDLPQSRLLNDGDHVAFSGPVPYSWGYGAPVV
jgi:hypothetical protein